MTDRPDITGIQQGYLRFMFKFLMENDQMPTIQIMADHYGVRLNAVYESLRSLEKKGYLARNQANRFKRGEHFHAAL